MRLRQLTLRPCVTALLLGGVVFMAGSLPFVESIGYGLVNCDDHNYVATYRQVTDGLSYDGVKWGFSFCDAGIWMPLTWASYMLDYDMARVAGETVAIDRPIAYRIMHAHNVALHGLNAVLLFVLLSFLAKGRHLPFAACAALVWAVHPLRCESVVWIASRKDLLSMAGLLVALICWVKFRRTSRPAVHPSAVGWYALSVAAFMLGAMAKPSVMCYPALVAVLDWFILRRDVIDQEKLARMCMGYVLPLAIAGGIAYTAWRMQAAGGCTSDFAVMPFIPRCLNAAVSFGVYLFHTVVPVNLAPQRMMRWPKLPDLLIPGLAFFFLSVCWLLRRLRPEFVRIMAIFANHSGEDIPAEAGGANRTLPALAGGVWYVTAVIPFLGLSGFGYHAFADRFTYIPAVGISLALVTFLRGRTHRAIPILVLLALVICGALTVRQTRIWQDDRTLWERTIAVDGECNSVAMANLGTWYYEHPHDLRRANELFWKAYKAHPALVQKTCFIHIESLAEAGELERAYEMLKSLSYYSHDLCVRQQESMGMGEVNVVYKPLFHYRLAHAACFLHDPVFHRQGHEEVQALRDEYPDNIHVLYLVGVSALLRKDFVSAELAWTDIKRNVQASDYVRYRFFGDKISLERERTRRELENEKDPAVWDEKNEALRRIGLRPIPNPKKAD